MPQDLFVEAPDGVRLAVRDAGGTEPPLVLLHGAGSDLLSVGYLARQLRPYRVVSMDARWSGQSGDSPTYSWHLLVTDVEAVVSALALGNPPIVGHSWGGMIAAHYGARHPETPGVVNLDGHGSGDPSLYDGMTAEDAAEALARSHREVKDAELAAGQEGDDAWHARALDEAREAMRGGGVPGKLVEEFAARRFIAIGDGRWRRHPSPQLYKGLAGDLRVFDLHRRVKCPLLIMDAPAPQAGVPLDLAPVIAAYRRGLTPALAALARECRNVQVVSLPDATHGDIVAGAAPEVAGHVKAFLGSVGYDAE